MSRPTPVTTGRYARSGSTATSLRVDFGLVD